MNLRHARITIMRLLRLGGKKNANDSLTVYFLCITYIYFLDKLLPGCLLIAQRESSPISCAIHSGSWGLEVVQTSRWSGRQKKTRGYSFLCNYWSEGIKWVGYTPRKYAFLFILSGKVNKTLTPCLLLCIEWPPSGTCSRMFSYVTRKGFFPSLQEDSTWESWKVTYLKLSNCSSHKK